VLRYQTSTPLISLVKAVVVSGEISVTPSLISGQNASFFMGPQLSCQNTTTWTIIPRINNRTYSFPTEYRTGIIEAAFEMSSISDIHRISMESVVVRREYVLGATLLGPHIQYVNSGEGQEYSRVTAMSSLTCTPQNVIYSANVSWINGVRNLTYEIDKLENLTVMSSSITNSNWKRKSEGTDYAVQVADVPREIQTMNSYAILQAFMQAARFKKSIRCFRGSNVLVEWKTIDGTEVPLTEVFCEPVRDMFGAEVGKKEQNGFRDLYKFTSLTIHRSVYPIQRFSSEPLPLHEITNCRSRSALSRSQYHRGIPQ
jgi:hypothetical protein